MGRASNRAELEPANPPGAASHELSDLLRTLTEIRVTERVNARRSAASFETRPAAIGISVVEGDFGRRTLREAWLNPPEWIKEVEKKVKITYCAELAAYAAVDPGGNGPRVGEGV